MIKFTKGVILVMKRFFTAIGVIAAALALSFSVASSAAAAPRVPVDVPTPMKSRIERTTDTVPASAIVSASTVVTDSTAVTASTVATDGTVVPANAVEQRTCRARFSEGVNHRRLAEVGSTILEVIPAGTWVPVSCERGAGGEYSACGFASDYWMEVLWNGAWGYSAWSCVQDWEYTS
jgi:hypothetical protein